MTIKQAQQLVDDWITTYGVRYFSELTNMAILTEEVGELARIMSRKFGDQSFKSEESEQTLRIDEELADILWVVLCIANQTNVDLDASLQESFRKKTNRDKNRHLNNDKLYE